MGKVKYTAEQIIELKNNKYVRNCTSKHLVFTKECKIRALELNKNYILAREVFTTLDFPGYIIHSDTPKNCINRWKKNIQIHGLIEDTKGRKKKEIFDVSKMNKDEYIEYLEAKLALAEVLKKMDKGDYP